METLLTITGTEGEAEILQLLGALEQQGNELEAKKVAERAWIIRLKVRDEYGKQLQEPAEGKLPPNGPVGIGEGATLAPSEGGAGVAEDGGDGGSAAAA